MMVMDERRRTRRVSLVSEVQIQPTASLPATPTAELPSAAQVGLPTSPPQGQAEEAAQILAWGADLSEEGIGLLVGSSLQPGEEVVLKIAAPGSEMPIAVKGTVVWVQAAKPGFRVGVQFHDAAPLTQARILQLVTERLAWGWSAKAAAPIPEQPSAAQAKLPADAAQAGQTQVQPPGALSHPPAPSRRPLHLRRPFVTILLAVVALALLLQNRELQASVRQLKAQVTALQALNR